MSMIKNMGLASINGRMAKSMKAFGLMASSMEKVTFFLRDIVWKKVILLLRKVRKKLGYGKMGLELSGYRVQRFKKKKNYDLN